jgi:hypothetical protein
MDSDDMYKKVPGVDGIVRCPVCGSGASVWKHSNSFADESMPVTKAVMCDNGDPFGPQRESATNAGCLLFMPPSEFYRARISEAVKYWNEYAAALTALRSTKEPTT